MCTYDDAGSIGKRYRRQDEVGTPFCVTVDFDTFVYEKSATGIILKPSAISGKRRACGQIQEKMGDLLIAYRGFKSRLSDWERANQEFELQIGRVRRDVSTYQIRKAAEEAKFAYEQFAAVEEAVLKVGINSVEYLKGMNEDMKNGILEAAPQFGVHTFGLIAKLVVHIFVQEDLDDNLVFVSVIAKAKSPAGLFESVY